MTRINRAAYAAMYGANRRAIASGSPTRSCSVAVEADRTIHGEEVKFGGGKVIRDGMGQSQRTNAEAVDTIITNALIIDHWGIVKADIGLKDGRIFAIGKGGNPDRAARRRHRDRSGHGGDRGGRASSPFRAASIRTFTSSARSRSRTRS